MKERYVKKIIKKSEIEKMGKLWTEKSERLQNCLGSMLRR